MALILNLSLRSKGKDNFQEIETETSQLLMELVDHPDSEVQFYVKCTLYSLLNRESFKKEATRQGIKRKLQILQEQSGNSESQK
jgi:hypothetical protein